MQLPAARKPRHSLTSPEGQAPLEKVERPASTRGYACVSLNLDPNLSPCYPAAPADRNRVLFPIRTSEAHDIDFAQLRFFPLRTYWFMVRALLGLEPSSAGFAQQLLGSDGCGLVLQNLPEVVFEDSDLAGCNVVLVEVDGNAIDLIDAGAILAKARARIEDLGTSSF